MTKYVTTYKPIITNIILLQLSRTSSIDSGEWSEWLVGLNGWWAFDQRCTSGTWLPVIPCDDCFTRGQRESLIVGTHLLVSGREIMGIAIWRYELATNKWYKSPSMVTPRALFASATCGNSTFVAGGIDIRRRRTREDYQYN